jgi:hypothetical protein
VQTNQFTYLHGLLSTVPLSDFSPVCDCEWKRDKPILTGTDTQLYPVMNNAN